jgi:lichenan operon transcriptional antiterminator
VNKILTNKQYELVAILAHNKDFMSSEQISDRIGLSTRTIQRYIESINKYLTNHDVEIVSMRGIGYLLQGDIKLINDLIGVQSENSYERRIKDITLYLTSREYTTIEEIGEKISYSTSTLNKLLPQVKKYLHLFNLKFHSKPHYGISVVGSELNLRALMIDCSFIITTYGDSKCLLTNISNDEFQIIKNRIVAFLKKNTIVIADTDVLDLIMRTTIIISRCKQNCLFDSLNEDVEDNKIQEILEYIADGLNILIPMSEVSYLSMYMDIISSGLLENKSIVQEDINEFVIEALQKMKTIYSNLIIHAQVVESLSLHISLMFNRLSYKHHVKNPLLQDIKANYTLEMNYAITFAGLLEKQFDVKIEEDELAYLAVYFAMGNKKEERVKRVIILCNYGIGTSQLIKQRIKEKFPELEVVGIYPLYYIEIAMSQAVDLIISTVPLDKDKIDKPYIIINGILNDDSLQDIRRLIKHPEDSAIFDYLNPKSFFHLNVESRSEALELMSKTMLELEFFDAKTINNIYEREKISSTDIGNLVAIPHALIKSTQKSGIGVAILEKPIHWDKEKVQIIFMIALSSEDLKKGNVFKHLYQIVKQVSTVSRLIESEDFEAFIKLF